MGRLDEHRARLAAEMDRRGDWPSQSPWVREAVEALPRDRFAPDRLWRWTGHTWAPVDRASDPEGWALELYGSQDEAAITQVVDGLPASSLSCQAVVVDMLDSLLLEPGHRVVEAGTGSGWNAALLARRAGPGRVTSVEVDEELAGGARLRLAAAGADVKTVVGDAATVRPDTPVDRFIATYAVDRVPWGWVEQTKPGGRIVTPWGRLGHVALTVAADHRSATGWMQGLAKFMPARADLHHSLTFRELHASVELESEGKTGRDLDPLHTNAHLLFHLRVALPDVVFTTAPDEDGVSAWIHDGSTSWASLSAIGGRQSAVHQGGPRRLADEIEKAWHGWEQLGCPDLYDYGLTVRLDGEQFTWCRDPGTGPRWPQN
ncbi:methyltransferase domain-containing protein [Kitasatospora sp. MAP5-34]|uniref:methyltransferase domain-containing protein n=1 Tax=Kitasatospora sp. MAP5-34 TaxID=3035102 RepID=UPI002476B539|nr:methyltransferase domain-containing protein [Kitasatospora sp. MAP5-34]MDH6578546.1 protein-L-isoaspartate O-methyltransferase [Kitasatospora sp. MAP5-34]